MRTRSHAFFLKAMRIIFLFFFPFFLLSCSDKPVSAPATHIFVENLDIDSIGVRVIHYMDGKELLDTIIAGKDSLTLPELKEDMYLLAIYWPRTFVPHQIYRDKSFDKEQGDNYMLSKAFYVDPAADSRYVFAMDSMLSAEEIELNTIAKINVRTDACKACAIADKFWDNYNVFFARKDTLVDQLNLAYYRSVEQDNASTSRDNYLRVDSLKKKVFTDELYKHDFESLVKLNPESKASTFFVFYQLYQERDFEKYKSAFKLLTGKAKESKYYHMLQKQYSE